MQQEGEHTINTDLESVWQALNDPVMLKASIPGCESFEQIDAENLKASVRAKVGPVNAVFQVTLALSDVQAPNRYRLNGESKAVLVLPRAMQMSILSHCQAAQMAQRRDWFIKQKPVLAAS